MAGTSSEEMLHEELQLAVEKKRRKCLTDGCRSATWKWRKLCEPCAKKESRALNSSAVDEFLRSGGSVKRLESRMRPEFQKMKSRSFNSKKAY